MSRYLSQILFAEPLKEIQQKLTSFGTLIIQGPRLSGLEELKSFLENRFHCKKLSNDEPLVVNKDGQIIFFSEYRVDLSPSVFA